MVYFMIFIISYVIIVNLYFGDNVLYIMYCIFLYFSGDGGFGVVYLEGMCFFRVLIFGGNFIDIF